MTTYSANIGIAEPTPADPAVANLWGGLWNTNAALLDQAIAGLLTKSVAGNSNVALTATAGVSNEARNVIFGFVGALTGNIAVLFPQGVSKIFCATNATTGAFTLSLGANNGAGSPGGTTVALAAGAFGIFISDGTNVKAAVTSSTIGGLGTAAAKAASDNSQSSVASVRAAATSRVAIYFDANGTLDNSGIIYTDLALNSANLSGLANAATARANLGVGSEGTVNYTMSASGPSGGGNEGDIWDQIS